jgi:hypothetical protein
MLLVGLIPGYLASGLGWCIHVLLPCTRASIISIGFFFLEYNPKTLRTTYIVRFRQDTGISSPSLYPSPPVALVLPAVDPIGNSAPARSSRAIWEGRRLNGRGADMLASFLTLAMRGAAPRWRVDEGRETTRRRHGVVSARPQPAEAGG